MHKQGVLPSGGCLLHLHALCQAWNPVTWASSSMTKGSRCKGMELLPVDRY